MAQDPYLDALFANQANPPQLPPAPPQPGGPYQQAAPPGMAGNALNAPLPPPPAAGMPQAGGQLGGLMSPQAQGQGAQGQLSVPMLLNLLKLISSGANRGNQAMNPAPQPTDQYTPISTGGIRG
jgi:hypothetical protein